MVQDQAGLLALIPQVFLVVEVVAAQAELADLLGNLVPMVAVEVLTEEVAQARITAMARVPLV
jgi:hypothetical protein